MQPRLHKVSPKIFLDKIQKVQNTLRCAANYNLAIRLLTYIFDTGSSNTHKKTPEQLVNCVHTVFIFETTYALCNRVHKSLVFIELCPVLPPPSSSSSVPYYHLHLPPARSRTTTSIFLQLCPVPPPPSTSSCTLNLLSTLFLQESYGRCSLIIQFFCGIVMFTVVCA